VFLAGVTIAVLLIRAGLAASDSPATTIATAPTTTAATTRPATTRTRTRATTTATSAERFYTIEAGDTYGSIAAEFDTTVDRLRELNPDVDETQLTIGQRIRVE